MSWLLSLALLACPSTDDWPQFRGPGGLAQAVGEASIPRELGPESNVLWKADVPRGYSSPCLVDGQLVMTGYLGEGVNVVVSLDAKTGQELWRTELEGEAHPEYLHPDARPATPTPCFAEGRWVCSFGNYGVAVLNAKGEVQWTKRLEHPGYRFGVGPSPLVAAGAVILPRDGAPEAGILSFDLADGSELWTIDRFDYGESHGTPFLWKHSEGEELVIAGTRRVGGFDPMSGEPLWSFDGTTVFPCTTPTADSETLYFAAWSTGNATGLSFWDAGFGRSLDLTPEEAAEPKLLFDRLDQNKDGLIAREELPECRAKDAFGVVDENGDGSWDEGELLNPPSGAPGKNLMVAIPRGLSGDVSKKQLRWSYTRSLPYVSSPLLHRDRVWLFKAGGLVTCLESDKGKAIFGPVRLPDRSEYYASPVGAGDLVIACSAEGTLYLLDANADELTVVHEASFDAEIFATPAVVDGRVYLRTAESVWAFGAE